MTDFKKIVWLASYPKSGNTWVRLFLDAYFLGELDINEIVCSVGDDGISRYDTGDEFPLWRSPIDIQQLARPMAMLRTVLAYNELNPDVPLFVKTHQANMVVNGIELLPASLTKATIFIVRDPRDVFPSFANHMGSEFDKAVEQMSNRYQILAANEKRVSDFLSSWDKHAESFLSAQDHNVLLVKYEDLREDPETWFTKIMEHAGVTPDVGRVRHAIEMTELSKLKKKESIEGFKEGSEKAKDPFFNTGKVGKKIDPKYRSQIERAFLKTMRRLGYIGKKANGVIELH